MLAVAVAVARREGLPEPVAVSLTFPEDSKAVEHGWQERVVGHLGLAQWERVPLYGELDLIGPAARRVLRQFGPIFPFNAHFHQPIFDLAKGGAVITGVGGDEILGVGEGDRPALVLTRKVRARKQDLLDIPLAVARRTRRRPAAALPWLRPAAQREFGAWMARAERRPLWHGPAVQRWQRSGERRAMAAGLPALGARDDIEVYQPFLSERFLGAVAERWPRSFARSRSEAMRSLFADLLPGDVLSRSTKASFNATFFCAESRAFTAGWDGGGVDTDIVDVDVLKRTWNDGASDARTFSLLQAAWLASDVGREPIN